MVYTSQEYDDEFRHYCETGDQKGVEWWLRFAGIIGKACKRDLNLVINDPRLFTRSIWTEDDWMNFQLIPEYGERFHQSGIRAAFRGNQFDIVHLIITWQGLNFYSDVCMKDYSYYNWLLSTKKRPILNNS